MIADDTVIEDTAGTGGQSPTSSAVLSAIQRMGSDVSASLRTMAEKMEVLANPGQSPWGEQVSPSMQSHPKHAESSQACRVIHGQA